MTRWLRYSKTFFNLVSKAKFTGFAQTGTFLLVWICQSALQLLSGCSQPAWPGQNPGSWWLFSGELLWRWKITLFSLQIDSTSKWHQAIQNILSLSLLSSTILMAPSLPSIVPAHSSYYPLVPLFSFISLYITGANSVFQVCGPAGFWWELWFSVFKPTTYVCLSHCSGFIGRCSSVLQVTNQSCADAKWNQSTEPNNYGIIWVEKHL